MSKIYGYKRGWLTESAVMKHTPIFTKKYFFCFFEIIPKPNKLQKCKTPHWKALNNSFVMVSMNKI